MARHGDDRGLPRRGFLERLAAAALPVIGLSVGGPRPLAAQHAAGRFTPPDESWLRDLTGTHRTVFDVESHREGHALGQAKGFLDAYEQRTASGATT